MDTLLSIGRETLQLFLDSSLYLLLGFLLAGVLAWLIPAKIVARFMGGSGYRAVLSGALFGAPLPLCSCSVLPVATGLHRQGASKSSVMAFLISGPETGAESVLLTYALMGPVMAVFRPIAALVSGIFAGVLTLMTEETEAKKLPSIEPEDASETSSACCAPEHGHAPPADRLSFRAAMNFAFQELFMEVAPWLTVGIIAAGLISALVPNSFFSESLGSGLFSMGVMILIGIPIYVCASSSTPLAVALIAKGLNPGAALVFLLAGPATNLGTLGVLYRQFGKKLVIIYLISIISVSLAAGLVLNLFLQFMGLDAASLISGKTLSGPSGVQEILEVVGAVILIALIIQGFARRGKSLLFSMGKEYRTAVTGR